MSAHNDVTTTNERPSDNHYSEINALLKQLHHERMARKEEDVHNYTFGPGLTLSIVTLPGYALGSHVWPAASHMVEFFMRNEFWASRISHRRGIEIGAGTGLLGLGLSQMVHPERLILTDMAVLCPLLSRSVLLNQNNLSSSSVDVLPLCWGNNEDESCLLQESCFDFIVGSDVIYDQRHFHPLLHTLCTLTEPSGAVSNTDIFLGHKIRNSGEDLFLQMASQFFSIQEISRQLVIGAEGSDSGTFVIVHLKRKDRDVTYSIPLAELRLTQ